MVGMPTPPIESPAELHHMASADLAGDITRVFDFIENRGVRVGRILVSELVSRMLPVWCRYSLDGGVVHSIYGAVVGVDSLVPEGEMHFVDEYGHLQVRAHVDVVGLEVAVPRTGVF